MYLFLGSVAVLLAVGEGCVPASGPCHFQTSVPEFITEIRGNQAAGNAACSDQGVCYIAPGTQTLTACNNLNIISTADPRGVTLAVPTAQPTGTSAITLTCANGVTTASGFAGGASETGVEIIDQVPCFPCRFQTTLVDPVQNAVTAAGGTCDGVGICDLAGDAAIPAGSYNFIYGRDIVNGASFATTGDTTLSCNPNGEIMATGAGLGRTLNDVIIIDAGP